MPEIQSEAAATKGSYNLAGISSPAIDALIEKIIGADSRVDLTVACRAFDRVFRAGRYWVPQWFRATHPVAYWDQFRHPAKPPKYAQGVGAPEQGVEPRPDPFDVLMAAKKQAHGVKLDSELRALLVEKAAAEDNWLGLATDA